MSSFGDRMKGYEQSARLYLPKRMPMIIRVDGKAFHTFTRGFDKPWDESLKDSMTAAGVALVEQIQGAKLAYIQSDEISVLVTDYDSLEFEPWFGKAIQKICSVSASISTMAFNRNLTQYYLDDGEEQIADACFDSRCFVIPKEDVNNYFIWRQQDAVRNSIQGLGQANFSHKELHRKNTSMIQDMLFKQRNINWNDCEVWQKRGWCVVRNKREVEIRGEMVQRSFVEPEWNIPEFSKDREYIERNVFLA